MFRQLRDCALIYGWMFLEIQYNLTDLYKGIGGHEYISMHDILLPVVFCPSST